MMALARIVLLSVIAAATAMWPAASASEEQKPAETRAAIAAPTPVYRPPLRGAPGGRVGGGTRGIQAGRETFVLSVLAPDHTGLTVSEQPALYWFISKPTVFPVEVTIVDPNAAEPVLRARFASPIEAGVHRLRLADYGVHLAVGVAYRWYVAVVPDPDRRSKDILAGGALERVALPDELAAKLTRADKASAPFLYAEAGIWYDALATISDLIEAAPSDPSLLRQRAALVEQVGLPDVGGDTQVRRP